MTQVKKAARERTAPSSRARKVADRVEIKNINVPGHTNRVDAGKYEAMRSALLAVLPKAAPGLTQAEMFKAVRAHLPNDLFPGGAKANWWAKTVQLDLEAKRLVNREDAKPLRWHRSSRS